MHKISFVLFLLIINRLNKLSLPHKGVQDNYGMIVSPVCIKTSRGRRGLKSCRDLKRDGLVREKELQ
jgi:hypothetical protein